MEPIRDAERVVPADRHERVDVVPPDALDHRPPRGLVLSRIGTRGSKHGPALAEDPGDVARRQRAWRVLAEKTRPTIGDPKDLVPERARAEDDGADRRVQPRGVPAAREHADAQG